MGSSLDELAARLRVCRQKGNKLTLQCVLESAGILAEAKSIAKGGFTRWLRNQAHMTGDTANHHLCVAEFVEAHPELTVEIATLSIAKIYALSTLESETAARLIRGDDTLSIPLDQMSDLRFKNEFRSRFPRTKKRLTRQHAFQQLFNALLRVERVLAEDGRFAAKLTPSQLERLSERLQALIRLASGWKIVA